MLDAIESEMECGEISDSDSVYSESGSDNSLEDSNSFELDSSAAEDTDREDIEELD